MRELRPGSAVGRVFDDVVGQGRRTRRGVERGWGWLRRVRDRRAAGRSYRFRVRHKGRNPAGLQRVPRVRSRRPWHPYGGSGRSRLPTVHRGRRPLRR